MCQHISRLCNRYRVLKQRIPSSLSRLYASGYPDIVGAAGNNTSVSICCTWWDAPITAEPIVTELRAVFTATGGPPKVPRMDAGPELISQALQRFGGGEGAVSYIPPGSP